MKIKQHFTLQEIEKLEQEFIQSEDDFISLSVKEEQEFKQAISEAKKQRQISFKISQTELESIKARASEQGLKYQSVIKALIHQYATGKITI